MNQQALAGMTLVADVPLSVLGAAGIRIADSNAQFLLSSVSQGAAAIVALVLTANILFTQLQPYALPVRFLVLWDKGTKLTFAMLAVATLAPAVLLMLGWYQYSDLVVALFAASLVVLGWYIRSRPRSVSLDRFFDQMVAHPRLRAESLRELHHMCLSSLDRSDLDTFRKTCMLLFAVDETSDALYQFWNTVVERSQDEPEAVTPLAESIYTCASPLAVTYAVGGAARPLATGEHNPLFSHAFAEQSPHYLARLLLLCSERPGCTLVRQEVLENMLLLVLDLIASCSDGTGPVMVGGDVIPTLLGYLDEAEDEILLRVMRGDAVYHYLLFDLPGPERYSPAVCQDLEMKRRNAWDRIVGHVYHDHHWSERAGVALALWRDGGDEPELVTGAERIESIVGGEGADGLTCEWRPPRRGRLRGLLPTRSR